MTGEKVTTAATIAKGAVGAVGGLAIKLTAVLLPLVIVVVPPLLIHQVFPIVRQWWAWEGNGIERLALLGVLGVIPHLFTKAIGRLPGAFTAIYAEFHAAISDRWLPDCGGPTGLATMAKRRTAGGKVALKASGSLVVVLLVLVTVVNVATMLVQPAVGHITLEFMWTPEANTPVFHYNEMYEFVDGDRVSISCGQDVGKQPLCSVTTITPLPGMR